MAKNKHSQFIDIEAEESSSSYSSTYSSLELEAPTRDWRHFTDELIKKYEEFEKEEGELEEEISDEVPYISAQVSQQSLLPTKISPKLWVIKVKPHKEKIILQELMIKFANTPVLSLFCKDDLPGYIYIESYSKQHIQEHIKSRVTLVPLEEMMDTLNIKSDENIIFKSGMYVRIGRGKYKNDVGQVLNMQGPNRVKVRLVPRLPNKKLFDPADFPGEVFKSKDSFIYKKETFKNGFLEKSFDSSEITIIEPSFGEMALFCEQSILCGDRVKILDGELVNAIGIVESISGQELFLKIEKDNGDQKNSFSSNDLVQVHSSFVKKHFLEGDSVVYDNKPGVILNISDDNAIVAFSDFTEQKNMKINSLKLSNTMSQIKPELSISRQHARKDPYLFKEVTLEEGQYKGYKGIVKDCYGENVRVQLNSNLKHVNISRDKILVHGTGVESFKSSIFYRENEEYKGYKTPSHFYGQTPGYKTPSIRNRDRFGETPGYKTPSNRYRDRFGETPGYKTPGRNTPAYNKFTAETPGYRSTHVVNSETSDSTKKTNIENKFAGVILNTRNGYDVVEKLVNSVFVTRKGNNYDKETVKYVLPNLYDRCVVLDSGEKGIVMNINERICLLRLSDGSVKEINVESLAKSE